MQDQLDMRWLLDPFTRRRINDERMKCATEAMAALIQRAPPGQPIDTEKLVDSAMGIASVMVDAFIKERLL